MSLPTVLVLGGTGPAGICLLRELLHRKHKVVAYARTPSKVPEDLAADPLLEVSPQMAEITTFVITDHSRLSKAN